jgi:signal transduction histidine kinase
MGLAICKKIVEKNGGTMFAEAEENKGATFTLILPQSL